MSRWPWVSKPRWNSPVVVDHQQVRKPSAQGSRAFTEHESSIAAEVQPKPKLANPPVIPARRTSITSLP